MPERDEAGVYIRLSGQRFELNSRCESVVGTACTFGVRPENIRFSDTGESDTFPVTIEAETPLNEKVVDLVTTEGGREILVSRPADTPGPGVHQGESASLQVSSTGWMLFDAETGRRIEVLA